MTESGPLRWQLLHKQAGFGLGERMDPKRLFVVRSAQGLKASSGLSVMESRLEEAPAEPRGSEMKCQRVRIGRGWGKEGKRPRKAERASSWYSDIPL